MTQEADVLESGLDRLIPDQVRDPGRPTRYQPCRMSEMTDFISSKKVKSVVADVPTPSMPAGCP